MLKHFDSEKLYEDSLSGSELRKLMRFTLNDKRTSHDAVVIGTKDDSEDGADAATDSRFVHHSHYTCDTCTCMVFCFMH